MSSYVKGQLVWAKIKGYPWWPAIVQIVPKPNPEKSGTLEKEVLVNFIGENSHAVLTYDKVADFNDKFKQHSAGKNKKLQDSIKVAQRIQSGVSTYEEEREKLLKALGRNPASPGREEVKPAKGRPPSKKKLEEKTEKAEKTEKGEKTDKVENQANAKEKEVSPKEKEVGQKDQEKNLLYSFKEDVLGIQRKGDVNVKEKTNSVAAKEKEVTPKEKASPKAQKQGKDSRLVQKQKIKEKERENKLAREIETYQDYMPFRVTRSQARVEPIEEPSKSRERKTKGGASKQNKKESGAGNGNKRIKESKATNNKAAKPKARLLLEEEDDVSDDYQNKWIPPRAHGKSSDDELPSPARISERKFSGGKLDLEEEKGHQGQTNAETSVSRASESNKMEVEHHNEIGTGLKGLDTHGIIGGESLGSGLNNKRTNSEILKDISPIYTTQIKEREQGQGENSELIMKKMKLAHLANTMGVEEEKAPDEKVVGTSEFNKYLIKKFEENLSRILDKLSTKLQGTERLKEYDVDMIKMLEVIEEFENRTFEGSEFVASDLGKIFKTIHYLLIKNKNRLPRTGELVITALAKVLHKIKDKIIKFCLDNTDYMDALHLPRESAKPISLTAIDIDFEEIKAKIEEMGSETKVEAAPITTKIEEESTSAYSQQKPPVQVIEPAAPKPVPVTHTPAPVNLPACPAPKEVPKETIKSPIISHADASVNEVTLLLRKKICQKFAKLLQRSYNMDKEKSQKLTIRIEEKLNKFYTGSVNEYKLAIKGIHKLIKTQNLTSDELLQVLDMTVTQFNQMLKDKVPEIAEGHSNLPGDLFTANVDTDDLVRREPILHPEDSANFDFNAYLAAKLDNEMALKELDKKDVGGLKQRMIVEEPNSFIQDLLNSKEEGL